MRDSSGGMEAESRLVKYLTDVRVLAKIGEELKRKENVFLSIRPGLFRTMVMMMMAMGKSSIEYRRRRTGSQDTCCSG